MLISRLTIALTCVTLIAGHAHAQLATALVGEGQPLPNAPGYAVDSISTPASSGPDGWAFNCNTNFGGETIAVAYGTFDGTAPPTVLAQEIATDIYIQNTWEGFFGLSDDNLCNSAVCTRIADGQTGLDSVWYGDTVVAIEEEPYPHEAGWWWSFGSRPGATRDGRPYFAGGITAIQGGATNNRGLFYGFDTAALIIGGMFIDGLPDPVTTGTGTVGFDFRFSAYGTHYLAEVVTETGSSNNDNAMVSGGAVVTIDGLPLVEGSPVPEAAGGLPGENWDNFDYCGITEDGRWLLTGDTDGATATDEFVLLDGVIVLREGDRIDGLTIAGAIEAAYLNEQGDWAVTWDVNDTAGNIEVLIINGEIMLAEGMAVDIDGDGEVDEDTAVTNFTGIASLVLADRDNLGQARAYFTADVEVPGVRLEREFGLVLTPGTVVAVENPDQPGDETPAAVPTLTQNYPNPFNPRTSIDFRLPNAGWVHLRLFDLQGRLVQTLVQEMRAAGRHTVVWNGVDDRGQAAPAGTYLYRLDTGEWTSSRTMVLVR